MDTLQIINKCVLKSPHIRQGVTQNPNLILQELKIFLGIREVHTMKYWHRSICKTIIFQMTHTLSLHIRQRGAKSPAKIMSGTRKFINEAGCVRM